MKIDDLKSKIELAYKKYGTTAEFTSGLLLMIGCVSSSVKAARMLDELLDQYDDILEDAPNQANQLGLDEAKFIRKVKKQRAFAVLKLFKNATLLGVSGVALLVKSFISEKSINADLLDYINGSEALFLSYRQYIKQQYGNEADIQALEKASGSEVEELPEQEDADEEVAKEEIKRIQSAPRNGLDNVVFIDLMRTGRHPSFMLADLKDTERYWNQVLSSRRTRNRTGVVFENEILKDLSEISQDSDIRMTAKGSVFGYFYNPDLPDGNNGVSFGIEGLKPEDHIFPDENGINHCWIPITLNTVPVTRHLP